MINKCARAEPRACSRTGYDISLLVKVKEAIVILTTDLRLFRVEGWVPKGILLCIVASMPQMHCMI